MRVTPKITISNFIRNIHQQAGDILKAQEQIATHKRINRISDDPIGMGRVLGYRSKIAAIEQYEGKDKNVVPFAGYRSIEDDEEDADEPKKETKKPSGKKTTGKKTSKPKPKPEPIDEEDDIPDFE